MAESNTGWLESIAKIIGVVVSPRVAVTLFISSCVLLAAPRFLHGVKWVDGVAAQYTAILWIVVVVFGVLSGTYGISAGWSVLAKRRSTTREAGERERVEQERLGRLYGRLAALTVTEKHVLQEYIEGDSRIAQFNATLGRCDALCSAGILRITQMYGIKGTYQISDEAWDYLLKHKDLIQTPDNPRTPRTFFSEY